MEIAVLGSVTRNRSGVFALPYVATNQHDVALLASDLEGATVVDGGVAYPHLLQRFGDRDHSLWIYGWLIVRTTPSLSPYEPITLEEKQLEIVHAVARRAEYFARLRASVERLSRGEPLDHSREPIPDSIRLFVWQRDGGKCVMCGSRERLEFDHIIAVANGGATTERNLQLLCEPCNRRKGTEI